jgi:SAM-dependent methyltransferase
MVSPLHMYGEQLAGGAGREDPWFGLRFSDGTIVPLALARWLAPADATEEELLSTIDGPVLDVGCGPGRHLHALAARGVFALGVDLSDVAVALARDRGVRAIVGSIFGDVPGAGTWRAALLLDGNIGIGGAPERLLARIGALLSTSGEVIVELEAPGARTVTLAARLETARSRSHWFRWARVSVEDIEPIAEVAGYEVLDRARRAERWFARLRRCPIATDRPLSGRLSKV